MIIFSIIIIAWILAYVFDADKIFCNFVNEVFHRQVTSSTYYVFSVILGIILYLVGVRF